MDSHSLCRLLSRQKHRLAFLHLRGSKHASQNWLVGACGDTRSAMTIVAKPMAKKPDPIVELAASVLPPEPWVPVGYWWEPYIGLTVWVKEQCCFREWSDPYPGEIDGICGECNRDRPFERVPRRVPALSFPPHLCTDLFCNGERLGPLSCASAFAQQVNRFCDQLAERLEADTNSEVPCDRASSAYRALSTFKEHVPDWDPTGEYGGAFERWEGECARAGSLAWPSGPLEIVPLVEGIRRECEEAMMGARRAYEETMARAERTCTQALAEARRIRGEATMALHRNQGEEIRRWLSGPRRVNRRLLSKMIAVQEKADMEAAATMPLPLTTRLVNIDNEAAKHHNAKKRSRGTVIAALPEEVVAMIHLRAAIDHEYEKAEAAAQRAYAKAVARAERAYGKAMSAPGPTRGQSTSESRAWDTLIQLADRLTELDKRVMQAIGRFWVSDATENRDVVIHKKEIVKERFELPKRVPPAPPASGPRDPVKSRKVKELAANGMPAKQIARKTGVPLRTVYRWMKLP